MVDLSNFYEKHHAQNRESGFVFGGLHRVEPMRKAIESVFHLDDKLVTLDIGCRDCSFSEMILKNFSKVEYFGIDVDSNAVQKAQARGFNAIVADLETSLINVKEKYDLIILSEVLEHLQDPRRAIELIAKALKHNGKLLLSVPNAFRLKNRLLFMLGREFEHDYTHLRWFNKNILCRYLECSLLKLKKFEYINSNFLWVSPALMGNTIYLIAEKESV